MLPFATLLRINISLVTDSKINYGSLFLLTLLLLAVISIGAHLWLTGVALARSASLLRKVAGGLALAIAALCILGPLWLGYWEFTQLIDLV